MADKTVTVTVASGALYIVGGTGNSFFIDGSRPGDFTVDWIEGGTIRFDQSDSSNDGHPLFFSTSNSTDISTVRSNIISSGVTYYLDGSATEGAYTATTTFNAATTRYIEIDPASQTDFYFACFIHGIGMGGIMDIIQDAWGALTWGDNAWESSTNVISVTGQTLTPSLASVTITSEVNTGWGRRAWGDYDWGGSLNSVDVSTTGQVITPSLGTPTFESKYAFTGIAGTFSIGSVVAGASAEAPVTGESLGATTGTLSMAFGVPVTGQSLTTNIGKGWGAGTWDSGVWGGLISIALGSSVIPTGQVLTATIGTETVTGDATVSITGLTTLAISLGNETVPIGQQVAVTGQALAATLGSATITTETNVGWGRQTWGYGEWGDSGTAVALTGQSLTLSLGTESAVIDVAITATAVSLTVSTGTVVAGLSVEVIPTGQVLTTSTGTLYATVWTEIDPNVSMVWTELAA